MDGKSLARFTGGPAPRSGTGWAAVSNSDLPEEAGGLNRLIDSKVAERTNLREGLAAMHRVRLIAYVAFASVIFLTGPVLGIDPIEFTIPFERFLNPERVSMPDIDMDFDYIGRMSEIHSELATLNEEANTLMNQIQSIMIHES